jgi:hypothetical protein
MGRTKKAEEARQIKDLENPKDYYYNKDNDSYIIFIKSLAKNIVISGETHRGIVNAYCGEDPRSVEDICTTFGIPRSIFNEYKSVFDLTRDALSITDEEVEENTIEESVENLLEKKKFEIGQIYAKKSWEATQKQAEKWRELEAKQLNPFIKAIENWQPPTLEFKSNIKKARGGKVWVAGLSDLHFGSAANAKYMFSQPDWNTQKTVEFVDRFAGQIISDAKARNYPFEKAVILGLGDLIHSHLGKTTRGTELKFDSIKEEQFDYALNSLVAFIAKVRSAFPKVEVHSVGGNHFYEAEMALFRALACYFKPDKEIQFFHYSTRPAAFKIGSTLIMMDHGADSVERAYVPGIKNGLEKHVQSLLLQRPELLSGVKTKLFCQGDKHHWENVEYGNFEFIMFSTSLGGDEHSSVNNLSNRPRQSSLILDEDGLKEVVHTYVL